MYVLAGRPTFARPFEGVHRSMSLMSSYLLLQQCPACLVRLTCIVFVMGGKRPYSSCFVGWLVDSKIMNLCKGDSASLSEEGLRLIFLFEKAICFICFALVLFSTTHNGDQLVFGMYQGGNPFTLVEMGVHYQYTCAWRRFLSSCQFQVFSKTLLIIV